MMRKKNKVFLILVVLLIGVLFSACTRSVPENNTANNDNNGSSQLDSILASVAASTPVGEVTPAADDDDSTDEGFTDTETTEEADVTREPTATPLPPTATPTPTQATMVVPSTYTLHEGEWPYCIARRFDVDVDTMLSASNVSRDSTYSVGLVLTIPQNATSFDGTRMLISHPTTYTVVYGDTFYTIACAFGDVYPEAIAAANGMSVTDALTSGMEIAIP